MQLVKANSSALWKILFMMTVHITIEEPEAWTLAIADFYPIFFSNDNQKTILSNSALRKLQFKRVTRKVQHIKVIKEGPFF